jgi:hypothetical protein
MFPTQKHIYLDIIRVGEEHTKTINPQSPASRGRKTIFESCAEIFIYHLSFVISCGFILRNWIFK